MLNSNSHSNFNFNCFLSESLLRVSLHNHNINISHSILKSIQFFEISHFFLIAIHSHINFELDSIKKLPFQLLFKRVTRASLVTLQNHQAQRTPVTLNLKFAIQFFAFSFFFWLPFTLTLFLHSNLSKKFNFNCFSRVTLRVTRVTQNQNINISHSILNSIEFLKISHFFDCNLLLHYYWIEIYQKIVIWIVFYTSHSCESLESLSTSQVTQS